MSWDVDPAGSNLREVTIGFVKTGVPDVTLEDIVVIIEDGVGGALFTKTNLGINVFVKLPLQHS